MVTGPSTRAPRSLVVACLTAASGGLLDAGVYLLHHHVFASALNGNLVLLGLSLFHPDRTSLFEHLVPILATLVGVFVARSVGTEPPQRAALWSLALESALLLLAGLFARTLGDNLLVATVAFAGAFQMTNLRRIDRFSYNSTFVSGDLRDFAEGCFESIDHGADANAGTRARGRRKLRDFGSISLAFLAGVAAGAASAPHLGDRTFWLAIPLLGLAALGIVL